MPTKIKPRLCPCPTCGAARKVRVYRGADLRHARERADLKLRELARRSGLSVGYLSDVELDRRRATARVVSLYEALP